MALSSLAGATNVTPESRSAAEVAQAAVNDALTSALQVKAVRPVTLPSLQKGDVGPFVVMLQSLLGVTPMDGVFGSKTKRAVVSYQEDHGVNPTGVVNDRTWRSLTSFN